jgi:hypothetical protein
MQYSLNKVTTVTACNALLAKAQKVKQTLERKRRNLGESIDTFRERMDRLALETVEVQTLLSAFTTCYHALPEGKYKLNMNVKVKRLELRQARLDMKAFTYNVRALLAKQVKYNMLEQKLSAIDYYVIALLDRQASLVNVPERASREVAVLRLPVARRNANVQKNVYSFERRFLWEVTDPLQLMFKEDVGGGEIRSKAPSGWRRLLNRDR